MRIKMDTFVPETGTNVPFDADVANCLTTIAAALRDALGLTHPAVKAAMRWTCASERTVKYWIAGEHGPSGGHLIALARHLDAVFNWCCCLPVGKTTRMPRKVKPSQARRGAKSGRCRLL